MRKRPFYENRENHYDCHIWKHPNYPKHIHKHLEFAYVKDGCLEMTIDKETKRLHAGDCGFVYPNQIHSYTSQGEVALMLIIIDMEYIDDFFDELTLYELQTPFFHRSELTHYGQGILELLYTSAQEKNVPYLISKGMITVLFSDIFETMPMMQRKRKLEQTTIEKVLLYVNENIRFNLSAQEVANKIGISTYHLSRLFAKELKMSLPTYITQLRLNLACDLLKDTKRNITDIAYDVGFSSMRTFLRSFKEKYDCTPKEWRMKHEKASIQPVPPKL